MFCLKLILCSVWIQQATCSWDNWWTYDGISGPDFWGLLNPKWSHCNKGRKQSPVDINTNRLLFDPGLKPLQYTGDMVQGNLENTGRGLRFNLRSNYSRKFTIAAGPLAYEYRLSHLILHFGRENDRGSEHTINGQRFPGEIQLYFFNHNLYDNYTEAESQPNGLAILSILIQLLQNLDSSSLDKQFNGEWPVQTGGNQQLAQMLDTMDQIKYKGTSQISHQLNVSGLLPQSKFYLTYQGSLTEPPCTETAHWLLLNKPIYALNRNLFSLRNSIIIDGYGDNFRPSQPLNSRCIRTNIASPISKI